jgi:hypothetical protein
MQQGLEFTKTLFEYNKRFISPVSRTRTDHTYYEIVFFLKPRMKTSK